MTSLSQPLINSRDISAYEIAYTDSNFEVVQAHYRKRMLLDLLHKLKPKRILEIGCGLQTLAIDYVDADYFCVVEPGHQFYEKAQQDTKSLPKVRVVQGLIEEVFAKIDDGYDLILLSGLLHEVPDAYKLMQVCFELCHANTVLHINVPNANSLHRLLAVEMGLISHTHEQSKLQKTLQQPRIFDLNSLEQLAKITGFSVLEQGSYFVKPFTHAQMHALQTSGFLSTAMLDGLFHLTKHLPNAGSEIYLNLKKSNAGQ